MFKFVTSKQRRSKSGVIKTLFFGSIYIFYLADNDIDISKTHLSKTKQIIKLDFYLRLQNTENFALNASSPLRTHTTTHLQHYVSFQPTHKTYTDTTHLTIPTLVPKFSHAHQQYKHTLKYYANNNNQSTNTIHTSTRPPLQHTSRKIHHKRNQTNNLNSQ